MALEFNDTPVLNETLTYGPYTWKWNTKGWEIEQYGDGGKLAFKFKQQFVPVFGQIAVSSFKIDVT